MYDDFGGPGFDWNGNGMNDSFDFNNDGDVGFVEDFLTQEMYDSDDFDRSFSSDRGDFWDDDCESDEYDGNSDVSDYYGYSDIKKASEIPKKILTITKPGKADYPNKRRYRAACLLAEDISGYKSSKQTRKQQVRSRFILNNADMIPAADYLTHDTGFLYAQAIKENFDLPFELQDEDRQRLFEFPNLLKNLGKREPEMALEVWHWCLLTFLPFAQYDDNTQNDLVTKPLKNVYDMPREFQKAFAKYKEEHSDFAEMIEKW